MAKELPYFQFEPAEYLTGDISFCSLATQGLFTNLCSYYWQRSCKLTQEQFLRRINAPNEFQELVDENVIQLNENGIIIKFLDIQLENATKQSKTNSINGSKGGRPRKEKQIKTEIKPKLNPTESETKGIREDKIKIDKIKIDKSINREAIAFLIKNAEEAYSIFQMQNKSQVLDWDRMLLTFNDTIDLELAQNKISFDVKQLMPRLRKYCRSWISNQKQPVLKTKEGNRKSVKKNIAF